MTRPYDQRERARHALRTAAAIDAATLRELNLSGYPALRIGAVASRAGVAPRTVSLRARGKQRLIHGALRPRADALIARVEAWRPRSQAPDVVIGELVALHERTYRTEKALLEALVDGGLPRDTALILRDLDEIRLTLIARTMATLGRGGALRVRASDATAIAHALLSYPTWRVALTGPARHRAPRLITAALRSALLA